MKKLTWKESAYRKDAVVVDFIHQLCLLRTIFFFNKYAITVKKVK